MVFLSVFLSSFLRNQAVDAKLVGCISNEDLKNKNLAVLGEWVSLLVRDVYSNRKTMRRSCWLRRKLWWEKLLFSQSRRRSVPKGHATPWRKWRGHKNNCQCKTVEPGDVGWNRWNVSTQIFSSTSVVIEKVASCWGITVALSVQHLIRCILVT